MKHFALILVFSTLTLYTFGQLSQRIVAESTNGVAIRGTVKIALGFWVLVAPGLEFEVSD